MMSAIRTDCGCCGLWLMITLQNDHDWISILVSTAGFLILTIITALKMRDPQTLLALSTHYWWGHCYDI